MKKSHFQSEISEKTPFFKRNFQILRAFFLKLKRIKNWIEWCIHFGFCTYGYAFFLCTFSKLQPWLAAKGRILVFWKKKNAQSVFEWESNGVLEGSGVFTIN